MAVLNGCHDTRNMVNIKEIKCPQCSEAIEVFTKDGIVSGDAKCDECGFVIEDGSKL